MAQRRMFSRSVVESDAFLSLSLASQALYIHLCMDADDDGFCSSPVRTAKAVGCKQSDIKELIDNGFLIDFGGGVVVIKHWLLMNYVRDDRRKETEYIEYLKKLYVKDNRMYTTDPSKGTPVLKNPSSPKSSQKAIKNSENG